jgi:hypothetical protein
VTLRDRLLDKYVEWPEIITCWLCHQWVDYDVYPYPDDLFFEKNHVIPPSSPDLLAAI